MRNGSVLIQEEQKAYGDFAIWGLPVKPSIN